MIHSLSEFAKKKTEDEERDDEKMMKLVCGYINIIQLINLRRNLMSTVAECEILYGAYKSQARSVKQVIAG